MKKKTLFFTLAICLVLLTGVLFGCSGKCSSHEFTSANCVWNNDGTALVTLICGVCGDTISETADMKEEIITPATCEKDGLKKLTAIVGIGGNTFNTFSEDKVIPALGHDYSEVGYTWSADNATCSAGKTCANCNNVVKETVTAAESGRVEPTCAKEGSVKHTATFKTDGFEKQTKTVSIDKIPHDYTCSEPVYSWDNNKCTAKLKCKNCTYEKTATATCKELKVKKAKTCTEDGEGVYEVTFADKAFSGTQTSSVVVIPKGHDYDYGNPAYSWTDDNASCNATIKCKNCDSTITEIGKVEVTEKKEASCTEKGYVKYKATFENVASTTATTDIASKGGHQYGDVTYVWSNNDKTCTAEKTCSVCGGKISEKATTISTEMTKDATCTEKGEQKLTATFATSDYSATKTGEIAAKGHVYKYDAQWEGTEKCTVTRTCSRSECTEKATKTTTSIGKATDTTKGCTTDGRYKYTATVTFDDKDVYNAYTYETIPAGHEYGEVVYSYVWNDDNKLVCTATKTCSVCHGNKSEGVVSETKTGKFSKKEENGKVYVTYVVKFDNTDFGEKTYTFEITE